MLSNLPTVLVTTFSLYIITRNRENVSPLLKGTSTDIWKNGVLKRIAPVIKHANL